MLETPRRLHGTAGPEPWELTGLLDGLVAIIAAAVLHLLVIYQIGLRSEVADRPFLVRTYTWTILLRAALALALNVFAVDSAFAGAFWGDSGTYDVGGYQVARSWAGEPVATAYMSSAVSGYGWVYFVGSIYYLFGRNQLLVQLINGVIGGLTVLVIFSITARLFGRAAARWSALFMAFFPQMVFWSTGMYKDPAILLAISLAMFAVVTLRERTSPGMIALFASAIVALFALRFYVAYFVLFAALATLLFGQRKGATRSIITFAFLLAALYGALSLAVRRETLERQTTYVSLERLQITREDQASSSRSGFGQDFDVSTPTGALSALPTGLVYLLFAPFPWAISGLRQLLALPETLIWYALMPAFIRGLGFALRTQLRAVLPIVVFAVTLTGAYALMQGNVGTAYRQRTQVTMFFFMFMAVGIVERRRRRAGVAPGVPTPASSVSHEGPA